MSFQAIHEEPTKWGFKLWLLADMTGYTVDFDIYTGRITKKSDTGLSHDVMQLVPPLAYQGYELYCDNFYSSPALFEALNQFGITATGSFRSNRWGILSEVISLKSALEKRQVPWGTGYYIRDKETVACGRTLVSVMSTCHPGHQSENLVSRNCLGEDGKRTKFLGLLPYGGCG